MEAHPLAIVLAKHLQFQNHLLPCPKDTPKEQHMLSRGKHILWNYFIYSCFWNVATTFADLKNLENFNIPPPKKEEEVISYLSPTGVESPKTLLGDRGGHLETLFCCLANFL